VLHVLAQSVTHSELHLNGDVVGTRVADVSQEKQPGVQASQAVASVDEVVAPPQHFGAAVVARMHHTDVRIGRHQRFPIAALKTEVRMAEFGAARQGRTFGLRPADHPLLFTQRLPVPSLDGHVDAAHH
jgi:hypothetical protein